jgi:hypothetical protein
LSHSSAGRIRFAVPAAVRGPRGPNGDGASTAHLKPLLSRFGRRSVGALDGGAFIDYFAQFRRYAFDKNQSFQVDAISLIHLPQRIQKASVDPFRVLLDLVSNQTILSVENIGKALRKTPGLQFFVQFMFFLNTGGQFRNGESQTVVATYRFVPQLRGSS